jgi:hypothetical protein
MATVRPARRASMVKSPTTSRVNDEIDGLDNVRAGGRRSAASETVRVPGCGVGARSPRGRPRRRDPPRDRRTVARGGARRSACSTSGRLPCSRKPAACSAVGAATIWASARRCSSRRGPGSRRNFITPQAVSVADHAIERREEDGRGQSGPERSARKVGWSRTRSSLRSMAATDAERTAPSRSASSPKISPLPRVVSSISLPASSDR